LFEKPEHVLDREAVLATCLIHLFLDGPTKITFHSSAHCYYEPDIDAVVLLSEPSAKTMNSHIFLQLHCISISQLWRFSSVP